MNASKRDTVPTSRDRDGWLVDVKTGVLIGPDPQIERELAYAELERSRPMGRPRLPEGERRVQITMRWSPATIEALKAHGPGYTSFAEEAVRHALKKKAAALATTVINAVRRIEELQRLEKVKKKRNAVTPKAAKRAQPKAAKDRGAHAVRSRS